MTTTKTKPSIPLQDAVQLANELRIELLPYCDRVWTAGSVRRRKQFVGDVELICIPKLGELVPVSTRAELQVQASMFGAVPDPQPEMVESEDQLTAYLRGKTSSVSPWQLRPASNGRTSFGAKNKLLTYNGLPVDIFSGTWATFGMLFFVRTGDADWVREVMAEFKRRQRHAHPYGGVQYFVKGVEGRPEAITAEYLCRDEERVFELLGWPFTNPIDRTHGEARRLRRAHH